MAGRHPPERVVREFLARGTGCGFASSLAKATDGIVWSTNHEIGQGHAADASLLLRKQAAASQVVGLVYPTLRTAAHVAGLLTTLIKDDRWTIHERSWKEHPRDDLLVWLKWRTDSGDHTSVMGLAPFGCMPVHRRAPHVTLVIWPGGRENPFNEKKGKTLGFLDIKLAPPLGDDPDAYRSAYTTTETDVAELREHVPEGAARPDVTFCLPSDVRGLLWPG